MDLKALISKLDNIEGKKVLNEGLDMNLLKAAQKGQEGKPIGKPDAESDKNVKKKYGYRMDGEPAERDDADSKKSKKKSKSNESIVFKSAIAKELLKEFSLTEEEFQFSAEQEKWLGGADRQDPYIIAQMPGPKPPLSYFTSPENQAIAKQLNIGQSNKNAIKSMFGMTPGAAQTFADPATAPEADAGSSGNPPSTGTGGPTAGANDEGNAGEEEARAAWAAQQAAGKKPAADAQKTIDPNKLKRFQELLNKAEAGAAKPAASGAPATSGQQGKPAAFTPAELKGQGSYTIKPGDTLSKIAQTNKTTVQAIMAVNPQIKDPNRIAAGAKLTLPGGQGSSANPPMPTPSKPLPGKAVPGGGQISDTPAP